MKPLIAKPVNDLQREFNELCEAGGGPKGGPVRGKLTDALRRHGQELNGVAYQEMAKALAHVPEANPWHVCFAMGLCWGQIAQIDLTFFEAAASLLENWNDDDRKTVRQFYLVKGQDIIEHSLLGAYRLFEEANLKPELPTTLSGLERAQTRWLRAFEKLNPPYIGPWNATALFMTALFAQPDLAATMKSAPPILPPGGPISAGLRLLFEAGAIKEPPNTSTDEEKFAGLSAAMLDNGLMADLLNGVPDASMIDMHTAIYLLGTRDVRSNSWTTPAI